jgi:glycine hydroxymethyltransferase
MHVIAAKAVALKEASTPEFKTYQEQVLKNAKVMEESLKNYGFRLVSGGTDSHLLLLDLRNKELTGKAAENILDNVGITVNKNAIPSDPQSPFITSGIRIGTPAVTTRGMKEEAIKKIAEALDLALSYHNDPVKLQSAKEIVSELTQTYPLYR